MLDKIQRAKEAKIAAKYREEMEAIKSGKDYVMLLYKWRQKYSADEMARLIYDYEYNWSTIVFVKLHHQLMLDFDTKPRERMHLNAIKEMGEWTRQGR